MSETALSRVVGGIALPPQGFGLVFMGGGAKGAYQLGVWQAPKRARDPHPGRDWRLHRLHQRRALGPRQL